MTSLIYRIQSFHGRIPIDLLCVIILSSPCGIPEFGFESVSDGVVLAEGRPQVPDNGGLGLRELVEESAHLGKQKSGLWCVGPMGLENIVSLAQPTSPKVAGGKKVERLVTTDLMEQPLGQKRGVSVIVVVQAVPNGGLKRQNMCYTPCIFWMLGNKEELLSVFEGLHLQILLNFTFALSFTTHILHILILGACK